MDLYIHPLFPMMYRMSINNYIDHTLLKPLADEHLYEKLVREAVEYNFFAVCVPSSWIAFCKSISKDHAVKMATVVGFPFGYTDTDSKVSETMNAVKLGADEVDFVTNLSWVKSKKFDLIKREYNSLRNAAPDSVLKVILESAALSEDELEKVCALAMDAELDFVKTSTGFYDTGARVSDVKTMLSVVGGRVKIKASGGIKNYEQAKSFIDLGVSRLGCSESVSIFLESTSDGQN